MRKKAFLFLSSAMFAASPFNVTAQSLPGQALLSQSLPGQALLSQAVPFGQALTAAPGQQMVVEDFQVIPQAVTRLTVPTVTTRTVTAPTVTASTVTAPVMQYVSAPSAAFRVPVRTALPAVQTTQIRTSQPQTAVPAAVPVVVPAQNLTRYYYTQPATVYGTPVAAPAPAPVSTPPVLTPPALTSPALTSPARPAVTYTPAAYGFDHYAGLRGNYSAPRSYEFERAAGTSSSVRNKDGYALLANIGKNFTKTASGHSLRGELEAGHREYQVETIAGLNVHQGKTSVSSAMANLIAEIGMGFGAGQTSVLTPYIGIGGGAAQIRHADHISKTGVIELDDKTIAPAAQAILGVALPVGSGVDLSLEGRHFRAFGVERTTPGNITSKDDFSANEVGLGLNFNF